MNIVNFIYQNHQYPIELKFLKKYSNYFSKPKEFQGDEINNLFLINEFDSQQRYSEETIQAFIQYFKTGEIELDNDNIFNIKYLSTKYLVDELIDQVEEYINDNYVDLIEKILTMDENDNINMSEIQSEEENLISCHISEYISDDRLTLLPINVLYRLLIQIQPKKPLKKLKKSKSKSKKKFPKSRPKLKRNLE